MVAVTGKKRSVTGEDAFIGERLRGLRRYCGLSQEELGIGVGVSYQQIQKYEIGKNRIAASMLKRFADILEVTPNFFYGIEDTETVERFFDILDGRTLCVMESWQALPTKELREAVHHMMGAINNTVCREF